MRRRKNLESASLRSSLGRALAVLRTTLDLTQTDLARLSGVKRSSISEYEADLTTPDATTLGRLLGAMGYPWEALDLVESLLHRLKAKRTRDDLPEQPHPPTLELANMALNTVAQLLEVLKQGARTSTTEAAVLKDPESDRALARDFWLGIQHLSPAQQEEQIRRATPAERLWVFCELLCLESQRLCGSKPRRAEVLAELAASLAEHVLGGPAQQARLRGFALAHVANAMRAHGDLVMAERTFDKALADLEIGRSVRGGFIEEGLPFALLASLRRAQRRFEEAGDLLAHAQALSKGSKFKAQVLVSRAKLYEELGRSHEAVAILEACEIPIQHDDGRLLLCIRHNLADSLSKLGRFREADTILAEIRPLAKSVGGELDLVRLAWTEARVTAGLGRTEAGISGFLRVRGEFASREMAYDTALVSLELATLYVEVGCIAEVKTIARHLVPVFQAQEVHREALVALSLFRQATEQERITTEFLRNLLEYLRRARFDPTLCFSGRLT
jgi:transcriptional regulator with XRE-family HTH domain